MSTTTESPNVANPAIQPMTPAELETYRLHRRFDRMGRLIGDQRMEKLMRSHVMVIGLGGVGSWAAESVARSGVGEVTLVDFDEICVTNFNRQLHALHGLVGSQKVEVMAERLKKVNPQMKVNAMPIFYNADHCAQIFVKRPDYVIDAIDNITAKCHLLNYCREQNIPVVCSTGSGGRLDPTQVKVADLAFTDIDPLARVLRKVLRQEYQFPVGKEAFGIPSVYSVEPATEPIDLHYDKGKGFRCVCPQGDNPYFTCDSRNLIMGNASFVTGTFGFICASVVVRALIEKSDQPLPA
jgi:tRNA A37 threonylcarbamoyladenosine dehydratase